MSDLVINPNSVSNYDGSLGDGIAGETITAGMALYKDATDGNKLKKADANATAATAVVVGFALGNAGAGQPLSYQKNKSIDLGVVLTVGEIYVLSATAGGVAPVADLVAGWRTVILGVAVAANKLTMVNSTEVLTAPTHA